MKEIIFTEKATKPTAPYSQAIKVGNTVYLAGVCGDDPVTEKIMGDGDMKIEATYALDNLKHTIEAAGGTMNDIVKVQVYVNDIDKMAESRENKFKVNKKIKCEKLDSWYFHVKIKKIF